MLNSCVAACEDLAELLRPPTIVIQPVESLAQLQELFAIDQAAYADCSLDFDTFRQWWQRYELGSRVLLSDDRIVASVGIYPLYTAQAIAFEQGSIPESSLTPATHAECDATPSQHWYASGVVVAEQKRGWGSPLRRLLRAGLSAWLDSGHVAYPLEILSIAEYEIGREILEMFGFVKVRDGSQMPDGCDLYKLSLNSSRQADSLIRRLR